MSANEERDESLKGRVAVVTGGTGALGRAVVDRFLSAGATVYVPWIDEMERQEIDDRYETDRIHLQRVDLSDEPAAHEFYGRVTAEQSQLDILCNIAGGFTMAKLSETSLDEWNKMLEINATTAFLSCRAAAKSLRASSQGRIVNVTAMPALTRGDDEASAYAASKAAVLNLTQSLSAELADSSVTVNAIAPSVIDTPDNREAMPEADRSTWLAPEEIARVIAFLVGPAAGIVRGSVLALSKGS